MIEFIIAFVPIFVLFLGSVQLALLSVARLVVQHAAVAGARTASVVLDDDPRYYDTPRGDISDEPGKTDKDFERQVAERVGADAKDDSPPELGGPRMAAIRRAVHVPLAAIAPEPWLVPKLFLPLGRISVANALGTLPSTRLLFGLLGYLPATTAVTFPNEPGAEGSQHGKVDTKGGVTVRVTHIVPCVVPVVASLMCRSLHWDEPDEATRRALSELREAPHGGYLRLLAFRGVPVKLLRAEATMPAQNAPYRYRSEREGDRKKGQSE
jgi:hypothetical protein